MTEYIKRGELYLPKSAPPILEVYVDETYLNKNSGFVQSALVLPGSLYDRELESLSRDLLRKIQANAKEFKGSKLTNRHYPVYRDFLAYYVSAITQLVDICASFHSLIAIDASDQYLHSQHIQNIQSALAQSFGKFGMNVSANLQREFSRQLYWLVWHLPGIVPVEIPECHFRFVFDAKHNYAKEAGQFISSQTSLGAGLIWKVREGLRTAANALIPRLVPQLKNCRIIDVDFVESEKHFGIQAADLFCHCCYSTIKEIHQSSDPIVALKCRLLREFASLNLSDVKKHTRLVVQNGIEEVECTDMNWRSHLSLG